MNNLGVAIKSLSSVEINHLQSNQHEFHGVSSLKKIFGFQRQSFIGEFYYVGNSGEITKDRFSGGLTWYDAREFSIDRSEYRFYYPESNAVSRAKAGDILVVVRCENNLVKIVIVERGTQFVNVLTHALGLTSISNQYQIVDNIDLVNNITNLFA